MTNDLVSLLGLLFLIVFIVWVQLRSYKSKSPAGEGRWSAEDLLRKSYTSLDAARHDGDKSGEGWALYGIASARMRQGNYDEAITHFSQAQSVAEEIDDRWEQMYILRSLGFALNAVGKRDEAGEILRKAVSISHDLGERDMEIIIRSQLGATLVQSGQIKEALEHYLVVVELAKAIGDSVTEADALLSCSQCYRTLGEAEVGEQYLKRAWRKAPRLKKIQNGDTAVRFGALYGRKGNRDSARRYFRRALDLFKHEVNVSDAYRIVELSHAASVINRYDDYHLILDLHRITLEIAQGSGNQLQIAVCLNNIAYAQIQLGQLKEASQNAAASLALVTELGDRRVEAFARSTLAELYFRQGEKEKVQDELHAVRSIAEELKDDYLLQKCDEFAGQMGSVDE
jgi:hypothetical protein